MESTILLKYLKLQLNTDLKIILLIHQNNYVDNSDMMNDVENNFDILAISLAYIIILTIRLNYF